MTVGNTITCHILWFSPHIYGFHLYSLIKLYILSRLIRKLALDGKHSSAWTLLAASTVIKRNIQSVYPVVNGPTDKYISILNTCFNYY
jgi:hypothetical protein